MSEDPHEIVPTWTRSEAALEGAAAVTSLVPLLGGPLSSMLTGLSQDRKLARINEVLWGLSRDVTGLSDASGRYVQREEFEDLLEQILRRVGDEPREQKRRMYQRFLVSAINTPGSYDERIRFLQDLDGIQPVHLICLRALYQAPHRDMNIPGERGLHWARLVEGVCRPEREASDRFHDLDRLGLTENVAGSTFFGRRDYIPLLTPHGARFFAFLAGDSENITSED